jgi:hypothetical protein
MFGNHHARERQLRKTGERAFATVLESQRTRWLRTSGDPSLVANTQVVWKLLLRVQPDDEAPFEAKLDWPFPQTWSPRRGGRFAVLYDPDDHRKVVIDKSGEGTHALAEARRKERTHATVARMRARGMGGFADQYQAIVQSGTLTNLSGDEDRREQVYAMQDRIREMVVGQAGGTAMPAIAAPPPMSNAGAALATTQALTRLADLHDRGVLTDEEFQTQKQKLLG